MESEKLSKSKKRRLRKSKRNASRADTPPDPDPEPEPEVSHPLPSRSVIIQEIEDEGEVGQGIGDNAEDEDSLLHKELDVTYDDDNDVGGNTFTHVVRRTVEERVTTSTVDPTDAESIVTTQVQKTTTTISTVNKAGLPALAPCPASSSLLAVPPAMASCSRGIVGTTGEGEDSNDGRLSAEPKVVKVGDHVLTSYVDEETGKIAVYEIGVRLEVGDFDDEQTWYPARIVEVDLKENEILVHYDNWSSRYDEWIKMGSSRLRPSPNTNVIKTQFMIGEKVEALWSIDGQRYPGVIQTVLPNDYYQVLFDDGIKLKKKYNQIFKIKKVPRGRSNTSPRRPPPSLVPAPGLSTSSPPARRSSRAFSRQVIMSPDDGVKEIPSAQSLTLQSGSAIPPISPAEDTEETQDLRLSPLTSSKSRGIRKKQEAIAHHSIFTPVTTDLGKRKRTIHDYSMLLKTRQPRFLFDDAALALAVSASAAEASTTANVDQAAAVETKVVRRRRRGTPRESESGLTPIVEELVGEEGQMANVEPDQETQPEEAEKVTDTSTLDADTSAEVQTLSKSKRRRMRRKATAALVEQPTVEEVETPVVPDYGIHVPKHAIAGPSNSPLDPYDYVLPLNDSFKTRKDEAADAALLNPTTPLPKRRRTVHNYSVLLNPKFDEEIVPPRARPKRFSRRINEILGGDTSESLEESPVNAETSMASHTVRLAERAGEDDSATIAVGQKLERQEEIVDVETIASEVESQEEGEEVDVKSEDQTKYKVSADSESGPSLSRRRTRRTQAQSLQRQIAAKDLEREKNLYPEIFGGKSIIMGKKSLEMRVKSEKVEDVEKSDPSTSHVKPISTTPVVIKRQSRLTTSHPQYSGIQRSEPKEKDKIDIPSTSSATLVSDAVTGLEQPVVQDKPRRMSRYKIPPQDIITTRRKSRSATITDKTSAVGAERQDFGVPVSKPTVTPQQGQVDPKAAVPPTLPSSSTAATTEEGDIIVMPPPTHAAPRKRRSAAGGSRRWRSSRKGSGVRGRSGRSSVSASVAKPRKVNHILNGLSAGRLTKLRNKLIDNGATKLVGGVPLVKEVSVDIINCACGLVDEHGLMVQCEMCQCWQHGNCFGIDCVEQMPPFYVCSSCQYPDMERSQRRQDWLHEFSKTGKLPALSFAPANPVDEEAIRDSLELEDRVTSIREIMHSTLIKIGIAHAVPDHPNIYQWHSPRPTPEEDLRARHFNKIYRPILKRLLRANIKDLPNYKIQLRAKVEKILLDRETKKLAEEVAAKEAKDCSEVVAAVILDILDKLDSPNADVEISEEADQVDKIAPVASELEKKSALEEVTPEAPILSQSNETKIAKEGTSPTNIESEKISAPLPVEETQADKMSSLIQLDGADKIPTLTDVDATIKAIETEVMASEGPTTSNVTDNLNLMDMGVDLALEDSDGRLAMSMEEDFDATFNLNPDRLLETIELSCNVSDDPEANDLLLNIFEDFADPIVPPSSVQEPQPGCSKNLTENVVAINPGPAPPVRITPELCRENLLKAIHEEQDLIDKHLDFITIKIEEIEQKQLERLRNGLPLLNTCNSEQLVQSLQALCIQARELAETEAAIKDGTYVPPESNE